MTEHGEITELLGARDQILVAAWALPSEGALTDAQRRQAMENFRQYLRRHGITPGDVGRQLGTPKATTITDLMKGVFRQQSDSHIRTLNAWVEQDARQRAVTLKGNFVSTGVAKSMQTVARLCRENGTCAVAFGPTGIGKSRCAQAIHETTPGSIFIRIITGYESAKRLCSAIAARLGVRNGGTGLRNTEHEFQIERVIRLLQVTNRLLILDEAHKLTDGALELVRDVHDTTGIPIFLVCTKDLYERITRGVDADHGQLYSRIDIVHALTEGKDVCAGGRPLFTVEDIKALYAQPPIRLSPDGVTFMLAVANQLGYGSLRRCGVLLRNAARRARKRQGLDDEATVTVTADDLEWVELHLRQESGEQATAIERKRTAGLSA